MARSLNFTTNDDPLHLHKTLGALCLVSYAVHFRQVGERDMGFDNSTNTPATIVLHLLLSLSSLLFRIPSQRITTTFRQWPQFRLHNIIFVCRSLAIMTVMFLEEESHPRNWFYSANLILVLATCAAADVSSHYCSACSDTIRDLDAPAFARYYFSVSQFYATAVCLVGLRRYTLQFLMVSFTQLTAFLMTLQRKNLASPRALIGINAVILVMGFSVGCFELVRARALCLVGTVANGAAVLRMGPLQMNKYLLWMGMGAILHWGRPMWDMSRAEFVAPSDNAWPTLFGASIVSLISLGFYKVGCVERENDVRPRSRKYDESAKMR